MVLYNKKQVIKILLVVAAVLVFYNIPKKYLGDTYPICLYRIIFGEQCIGCGTTRAIWSILHLNLKEAIEYNKLIVVNFPLLIGCCISWIMKRGETNESKNKSGCNNVGGLLYLPTFRFWTKLLKGAGTKRKKNERTRC
jgi:hypothetical protein